MIHPLLLLVLLISSLLFYSWYKRAPAGQKRQILIIGVVVLALILLASGRLNPLFAAAVALVPILMRGYGLLQAFNAAKQFKNRFKAGQGPTSGQASQVETRFLRMSLDHDTGDMDGEILEGRGQGSKLSDFDLETLLSLLGEWHREDEQSASLLAAYLDRTHGDAWRDSSHGPAGGVARGDGNMTREEALKILGLEEGAEKDAVVAAHRRLMQRLHPDRGGSDYLAAKINKAKDILLGA